jgi:NarL family two-component system response regulator LiaR
MSEADAPIERRIRVLIVDDHELFRHGMGQLLAEQGFEIVGEASSGEAAVALATRYEPDVVVMDLSMPGIGGIEATRRITERAPRSRVLVLTIASDEETVNEAIVAGAAGYLLKDATPDEIAAGVRAAAIGEASVSPSVAAGLLERVRSGALRHEGRLVDRLTERQLQVLRLLGRGMSNDDIAGELHITRATVKNHVASILQKLELDNRTEAAVYAARSGLV